MVQIVVTWVSSRSFGHVLNGSSVTTTTRADPDSWKRHEKLINLSEINHLWNPFFKTRKNIITIYLEFSIKNVIGMSMLCLQAWTNGRLQSVVHRAVVNREKKRLSIAYFFSPRGDAVIECHPKLVGDDRVNTRKYKPFTWGDFRKELLIQKRVQGKAALNRYLISS